MTTLAMPAHTRTGVSLTSRSSWWILRASQNRKNPHPAPNMPTRMGTHSLFSDRVTVTGVATVRIQFALSRTKLLYEPGLTVNSGDGVASGVADWSGALLEEA